MRITCVAAFVCLALPLAAQVGIETNQTQGPPRTAYEHINKKDANGNIIAICYAKSDQLRDTVIPISSVTLGNPTIINATHGFDYQSGATVLPTIVISGATGTKAALNGSWTATPTGTGTLTIPIDSTAFSGTSPTSFTTRAPRVVDPVWAIWILKYDATNFNIWSGWASNSARTPTPDAAGTPSESFICNNSATVGVQ